MPVAQHVLAGSQAGSEGPSQPLFRVRFLMQLGVRRASGKSGYEHIKIPQKSLSSVVWLSEPRGSGLGGKESGERFTCCKFRFMGLYIFIDPNFREKGLSF